MLHEYVNGFSNEDTQEKCQSAIDRLRKEGRTDEWIAQALNTKTRETWENYGFGVLFTDKALQARISALLDVVQEEESPVVPSRPREEIIKDLIAELRKVGKVKEFSYRKLSDVEKKTARVEAAKNILSKEYYNTLANGFWTDAPRIFDGKHWWYYNPRHLNNFSLITLYWAQNKPAVDYAIEHNDIPAELRMFYTGEITRFEYAALRELMETCKGLPTVEQLKHRIGWGWGQTEYLHMKY